MTTWGNQAKNEEQMLSPGIRAEPKQLSSLDYQSHIYNW